MKNLSSYLLVMFMAMFWIFRIIISITSSFGIDIGIVPLNVTYEIVLLFVTLVCMILVIKRKIIGALLYVVSYGAYFGVDLYNIIMGIVNGQSGITNYASAFMSFLGVVLPVMVLLELLFDKNRKNHPVDKKTDWFYKNEQFDRQYDERADKNNYRTL